MWIASAQFIFLLVSQGDTVFAQVGEKDPCSDHQAPGVVWQEGCLVKTCVAGIVKESLADECVELIEKQVDKLFEKKLSKKGGKYIYEFDKMEREDKFHNKLEDEFKNWEERCLENGGKQVLADYLAEQEELVYCIMEQFDIDEIQQEIEEKKKQGDLDEVFKKYCGNHVAAARSCLQSFLSVSQYCLKEKDRPGLNVTLQMVDSAIDFTCHNAGDRIALFMSEDGVECVTSHKEEILACINNSVPEVFNTYNNLNSYKMHFYVFQQGNCRKGDAIMQCVETSLMKCDDPTPSNLVHGLLNAMKDGTPCARAAQGWHSGYEVTQTRTQLLLAVVALASMNLSL